MLNARMALANSLRVVIYFSSPKPKKTEIFHPADSATGGSTSITFIACSKYYEFHDHCRLIVQLTLHLKCAGFIFDVTGTGRLKHRRDSKEQQRLYVWGISATVAPF
jgi:hypothetical protein